MRFGDAAELASQSLSRMTQLTWQRRRRSPSVGLRGVEIDVHRGAGGVVGIEHGLDRALADELARDGGGDALAGHVGQFLVHELRRIGAALADEAGVEPLLGDALELAEEMELRLFAGIAPLGVEQRLVRWKSTVEAACRRGAPGSGRRLRR
jgi:hypothetical protein